MYPERTNLNYLVMTCRLLGNSPGKSGWCYFVSPEERMRIRIEAHRTLKGSHL